MIVSGAIVPHAPLLTGAMGAGDVAAERVARTVGGLDLGAAEAVVVLSAHGRATGVYERARGSLREFGIPDAATELKVDEPLARQLASAWGVPVFDHDLDHGCLVPLRLLPEVTVPVVCASFEEDGPVDSTLDAARRLTKSVAALDARIAVISSAHLSAGLTERAPLGLIPGSADIDRAVIDFLESGRGDGSGVLARLASEGGSCGAGPLATFAGVFAGVGASVTCYEHPFGVGYLVAHARS